ncbi:MAG: alpha/beta hydrolase [Zoogloeaceae bacterium]|nr:alpha/beta hydrolase [Zoogloeaceae bacterium]
MNRPLPTEQIELRGPAGKIDALIDVPHEVRGIALVCHPHPLFSGTNTNKVAHTLARTFRDLNYATIRPNFRGVGGSEGTHDEGWGETEDMLSVIAWAQSRWGMLPLAVSGFSFGAFVASQVAKRIGGSPAPAHRIALVGTPSGEMIGSDRFYDLDKLPEDVPTLLIHGEKDNTCPLQNVFDWAGEQDLPVSVIPGADHFFGGKLHVLRMVIEGSWAPL